MRVHVFPLEAFTITRKLFCSILLGQVVGCGSCAYPNIVLFFDVFATSVDPKILNLWQLWHFYFTMWGVDFCNESSKPGHSSCM